MRKILTLKPAGAAAAAAVAAPTASAGNSQSRRATDGIRDWPADSPHGTDEDTGHGKRRIKDMNMSLHGDSAARRRAITELLFFASVGDMKRCERIARIWNLQVGDAACCDYDKRTPLHLAASEGAFLVSEWLLAQGACVNAVDRFNRTPLEDALRGGHREVAVLLLGAGGKLIVDGGGGLKKGRLVELAASPFAGALGLGVAAGAPAAAALAAAAFEFDVEWEVDPDSLTIMEKLGEGEFGVVHKARWHGSLVAVKILKGSSDIALGDFRGEVEILRRVHHPNAVQFLGACTKREPYMLITELMSGGSLADAFRRPEAFPLRRAVEIALDSARGLAYLHNRQPAPIIHRDLKPGNLMLAGSLYADAHSVVFDTGVVKLADFGLSKTLPSNRHADIAGSLDDKFRLTGETGSYRYMAPEVFRHEPYNSSVDVYSYSMIAYQLLEFQPPFAGVDPVDAARQAALYDRRPAFVNLAAAASAPKAALRALIERCWAPSAEDRPSFPEVVVALEAVLEMLPVRSAPGGGGACCVVS